MNSNNEDYFAQALEIFKKQSLNQSRESYEKLSKKNGENLWEREEECRKITEKTGHQTYFDRIPVIIQGYRFHAELIGEDFLSSYLEIINPNCGIITDSQKGELLKLLASRFEVAGNRGSDNMKALYASEGRQPVGDGTYIKNIYMSMHGKIQSRLIVEIMKHNLGAGKKETQKLKDVSEVFDPQPMIEEVSERTTRRFKDEGWTIVRSDDLKSNSAKKHSIAGIRKILKDQCREECEKRKLPTGQTLSRELKYEIAQAIDIDDLGSLDTFKSGNPPYHFTSKMLSELGYCKKNPSKYRK